MIEKKEIVKLAKPESKLKQATSAELSNLILKKELFTKLKELLNNASIEQAKLDIVQNEAFLLDTASLIKLKSLNSKIILPVVEKIILNIKSIDLKNFSLEKIELDEEKKAQKILEGLLLMLPEKIKSAPEIADYANRGAQGLAIIEKQIMEITSINQNEIKKTGFIFNEFSQLQKTIHEQNAVVDKILFQKNVSSSLFAAFFRVNDIKEEAQKLKSLVVKEILVHNSVIKDITEFKISEEYNETSQIRLFEDKEIEILKDLELLLNQFNVPKINLGQEWAVYKCSLSESLLIAKEDAFVSNLPIYKEQMIVNGKELLLNYIQLKKNSYDQNGTGDIFLLVPLSQLKSSNIYSTASDTIKLYFTEKGNDIKKYEIPEKKIDELISNVNEKMKNYLEYTKKLDDKFSEEWSEDAIPLIKSDFTKRWINESSQEFFLKKDIDIMKILICQKIYQKMLKAKVGEGKPGYDSVIESIKKMSKDEFIAEIEKAREFCKESLKDAGIAVSINKIQLRNYILCAPKSCLIYIEKYFDSIKKRPQIYYYHGKSSAAVEEVLVSCNATDANTKKKEFVKDKSIRIFEENSYLPLCSL
ncbi:MAG: hypothetical protein V1859_09325 [archaeon]